MTRTRLRDEVCEATDDSGYDMRRKRLLAKTVWSEHGHLHIEKAPEYTARDITRIRMRVKVSQRVFALYLNTTALTVRHWECGHKKPSGTAARMLQLIQMNGLDIFE
jgi:putative transcriptional regulator